jgi:hypothetical protein
MSAIGIETLSQANRRLNEKKSKLASVILDQVKEHLRTSLKAALLSDPVNIAKIRAFIRWSVKPDGPAFFLKPTPIDCTVKAGEQGYVVGFFSSTCSQPNKLYYRFPMAFSKAK